MSISVNENEAWLLLLARSAAAFGHPVDPQLIHQQMRWHHAPHDGARREKIAALMGLQLSAVSLSEMTWHDEVLPAVLLLKDGTPVLLESLNRQGLVSYWLCRGGDVVRQAPLRKLLSHARDEVMLIGLAQRVRDDRIDEFLKPWQRHWFWKHFRSMGGVLGDIALASLVANTLTLAGILFSMQVYDRVIPAQSWPSLWVLAGGVLCAVSMEFVLRLMRSRLADVTGKQIDLRISAMLFARTLAIRNEHRPKATGSFISQLREIDQLRELLTSTTLGAVADIPFIALFLALLAFIGGSLAWIPLLALPLILIPGLLIQLPLSRLTREGMREGAIRNAVLVEAVEGVEDIKALQAEPWFQRQWEQTHEVGAQIAIRQREWAARFNGWVAAVQQLTYAGMLIYGVFLIIDGSITTGTLVACSLLSSRAIAPLLQLTLLFSRWQHARSALHSLDELLKKPLDAPEEEKRARCTALSGHYSLRQVRYAWAPESGQQDLQIENMQILPGQRVAVLGRVGAGKSTLLKLLAGQVQATQGKVLLGGVDMKCIDPQEVRHAVGWLSQEARLFFGTLRQNLLLGNPCASEQAILEALRISGALSLTELDAASLDRMILEGGRGLSGGQKQMILLSRLILRNPRIVLLDEPTASMDEQLEQQVIHRLGGWLEGRTLVLVTHRPALLRLTNRVVVMDNGHIIADGARDEVLKTFLPAKPPGKEHAA
ncbi:type I secretion system permease/ATPase [Franconibacter helveticus]|uniref:type I secretion system permease/ATPase n=1 Tax=Franconibacter helveticus TaxID=357240 RepID=UPI00066E2BAA|nr:type I secretion system permease/ATPase [Franconibacter helveticus]